MFRNRLVLLCLLTGLLGACGGSTSTVTTQSTSQTPGTAAQSTKANPSAPLPGGDYPVQQVSYDDSNGQYSLMLLNTPQGTPPVYRTDALQMARLSEEDVKAGKASYFQVQGSQATLFLDPEFQIQYVPTVAETQVNPNTGQSSVVYVRQQPTFWSPFATGMVAGAIASDLLTPRYYVPPAYSPGRPLMGYGGYGNTYDRAVSSYQSRYNEPPRATRSSTQFRTTGSVNRNRTGTGSGTTGTTTRQSPAASSSPSTKQGGSSVGSSPRPASGTTSGTTGTTTVRQQPTNTNRSTGSGFGSSTLRNSGGSSTSKPRKRSGGSSFGSSGGTRSRPASRPRRRRR